MIYLMRHAQDDEYYIGGWSNVGLTIEGIGQAQKIGEFINKNIKFNSIITSDVERCLFTSEITNKNLDKKDKIIKDSNLRELNKGLLNGMSKLAATSQYPEFFSHLNVGACYPNGESMRSFYEKFIAYIGKLKSYDNCLVVTHRGNINALYYYLYNIELDTNKTRFGVEHASIHILDLEKKYIYRYYHEPIEE